MRILLANNHLGLGGSESYLFTVAEQLERLGHEIAIYATEFGAGAELARQRGLAMISEDGLTGEFDAALVQDASVSLLIAEACPDLPQLFVAHSALFDLQAPPQLPGIVGTIVVLNDRVGRRIQSFATPAEVVRLRQPIDTTRFFPRGALPKVPRRALLLSNNPNADRLQILEKVFDGAGIELERVGGSGRFTLDPGPQLVAADIVIGYGRSILEAMAYGRAVYVYDWKGGDGWVTADSYGAIESDGFKSTGQTVIGPERFADDLRLYSASMGPVNHDLVASHHRASAHANELIELLRGLKRPKERQRAPLEEMSRLVRLEWRARGDVHAMARENAHLRDLLTAAEDALRELPGRYENSLSWRITRPLRALRGILARVRS